MPSNKLIETAKNIVKRDKAVFETLMEFEKTRKIRTKNRMNFTIDRSLSSRFKKFCRDKSYNMSAKIEHAIKDILDKEDKV